MKSKEIIQQAKQRFKELEHKQFEWRSFYNGYLEGQAKQLTNVGQHCELLNDSKSDEFYKELKRQKDDLGSSSCW